MQCLRLMMNCTAVSAMLFSASVLAQGTAASYPSKPVTLVIPAAPGGSSDLEARVYAPKMSALLGQSFVIDYKGGAGAVVGTVHVAKSAPDGHTILLVTSSFTISQARQTPPFDVMKDFAPVSLMSQAPLVLILRPSFPAKSLKEYIAYAKANPEKINYGMTGVGSTNHLAGAWLHSATKTKATYIAYKGMAPIMQEMMAGRTDASVANLSVALPHLKAGKLRALAILGDQRSKLAPELPTVMQQGVPDYNYTNRLGFVAPAATPPAIVKKVSDGLAKVAKMPDVVSRFEGNGVVMVGSTPEQFKQILASEIDRWRKVVKEGGIKLE